MTNPILWGPPLWQAMFACAWHCDAASFEHLYELLLRQIPLLIPCEKCRHHFATNKTTVDRRARGEPKTPEHAFRWLWYLKDEINRSLRRSSVSLDDVTERHLLHGGIVDDVALGDALVLVAIEARTLDRDDLFVSLCHTLTRLLPLPVDSELRRELEVASRPIVPAALRAAKAARIERGLPQMPLAHYRSMSDDHPTGVRASRWL